MADATHFVGLVCAIAVIVYGVLVVGEKFDD
jgi:hypothetical protein